MGRPENLVPWSDDANYAAGADPWSGTATKVEYADNEFTPGDNVPAQAMNHELNRKDTKTQEVLDFVGALPAATWPFKNEDPTYFTTADIYKPCWDAFRGAWLLPATFDDTGDKLNAFISCDDGRTWERIGNLGLDPATQFGLAVGVRPTDGQMVACGVDYAYYGDGSTWTAATTVPWSAATGLYFNTIFYTDRLVTTANELVAGTFPIFWYSTDGGINWTAMSGSDPGFTEKRYQYASNGTMVMAMPILTGPGDFYATFQGATRTAHALFQTTDLILGVAWDSARSLWVSASTDGSDVTFWTSLDGATWTAGNVTPTANFDNVRELHCLGSLWMGFANDSSGLILYWTDDQGLTFRHKRLTSSLFTPTDFYSMCCNDRQSMVSFIKSGDSTGRVIASLSV